MATDIRQTHFSLRCTPAAWHPYVKIARLDRPIGTWLLLWPCLWSLALAAGRPADINWQDVFLFSLGALVMRSAGCIVNDLWDRKLDAAVERTRVRPLPAGDMTPRQALAFLAILLMAGLAILLQFNLYTIVLGCLSLLLVVTYPLMKRVTWWPQAFLGLTFNWGVLMGWAAVHGTIAAPAALMYAGGIFWTLAYDTIYAHQDIEDDATIGIKSTARLFGARSKYYVAAFFAAAMALFIAARMAAGGTPADLLLALPASIHAIWQIRTWKMKDTASSLAIFKSNRIFGALLLLMFLLPL